MEASHGSRSLVLSGWEVVPFALTAVVGLLAALLPGPGMDPTLYALACALTAALAITAFRVAPLPVGPAVIAVLAITYFLVVALLRHATEGSATGFTALVMLPVVWLALYGSRRMLAAGIVALAATLLVPYLIWGDPQYPSSSWRSTLVWIAVGSLTGLTIQSLVMRTRASRDRLASVLDAATGTAIIGVAPDGTITTFNRGAEHILGWTADELVDKRNAEILLDTGELARHAADMGVEPGRDVFRAAMAEGGVDTRQLTFVRKDGERIWVSATVTTERGPDGEIVGFLGVATDITERVRAQELERLSAGRLQGILDHTTATISVRDREGRYLLVNRRWEEFMELSAEDVIGRTAAEVFPADEAEGIARHHAEVLERGEPLEYVRERRGPDGVRVHDVVEFPLRDADGAVYATGAVAADVTDRQRAHAEAVEASRAKSEFLANMSHEIRTPLNGVIGMLDLLKDTGLGPEQQEYVRTAESSGEALLTVINDILDFSKMEAGRLEIDDYDFDLRQLVEDTCEMIAAAAHGKGLELVQWIDDELPSSVRGDGGRLRQVLTNLLSNAVKFTEQGQVAVRVAQERREDGEVVVRFEVTDTGIGIEPERIEVLFEPFAQADASTTRRFGGTGLGLAIARQLVAMMGGELGAASVVGEGSTFGFTTRLGVAAGAQAGRRPRPVIPEATRLLVVDDNATNREILRAYLREGLARCDEAPSGDDALGLLHAAADAGEPYEVVIVDGHMPGMDGIELARRIRAAPRLRSARLLLLTSASGHGAAARDAGVERVLSKPVRRARLLETITELLRAAPDPEPEPEQEPEARFTKPARTTRGRVLVAEDNEVNRMVILGMLAKRGIEADVVGDGAAAVEGLRHGEHDIVFMDCQMPVLDGYQATARIRELEGGSARIPIVAMTANAMAGDRERCLQAGMDDYVPKPVRAQDLDMVLDRWLGAGGEDGVGVAQLVDEVRIRSFVADFPGMAEELLALFADTTPALLEELRAAVERHDPQAVARTAHELKGSCRNMGAVAMGELCASLERGGTDRAAAVDALHDLLPRTVDGVRRVLDGA
jgi:PAS domain S-box-containing protein